MSASVSNYLFAMEERQRALRSTSSNTRAEPGVGVPVNSPAKRCLFGAPDPVELKRKYEELHEEERNRGAQKWGFDFETETPLENSRYEWERVESGGVPIAYDLPQLGPSESRPEIDDSTEEPAAAASSSQQPASSSSSSSGKQMHITGNFNHACLNHGRQGQSKLSRVTVCCLICSLNGLVTKARGHRWLLYKMRGLV